MRAARHRPEQLRPRVVVVTQPPGAGRALAAWLGGQGFDALAVHDTEAAIKALAQPTAALVCDVSAAGIDGLVVLEEGLLRARLCALLLVRDGSLARALQALERGAWDYFTEPLDRDRLLAGLRQGIEHQRLAQRTAELEQRLDRQPGVRGLAGSSRAIQRVREVVRRAAGVRAAVMLEGEPGTGKSTVARALHHASARRERRFEHLRCGHTVREILEAELFGWVDRFRGEPGVLERTNGGTVFLEDVGQLSRSAQLRLLRFVTMGGSFERVGDSEERRSDVRIVTDSEIPLEELVARGEFHPELHAALSVIPIHVPPLRERLEDLPVLMEELVRAANAEHKRRVSGVTAGVLDRLAQYPWPGNVRELRGVVDRMVATARGRGPLDLDSLPNPLRGGAAPAARLEMSVGMTLAAAERRLVEATLTHTQGDKPRAAAMLGIGLRTLYRRLDEWGLR
ncbi:MAG: sigma-54 dependent transcriptional regulator [Candidatus Eisenbacteria bacterium]